MTKRTSHWSACTRRAFPTQLQINMSELALWWPFVSAFLLKENSCWLCFKAISKKDAKNRKLGTIATSAARYQVDRNTRYCTQTKNSPLPCFTAMARPQKKRWFGKTQSTCSGPQRPRGHGLARLSRHVTAVTSPTPVIQCMT